MTAVRQNKQREGERRRNGSSDPLVIRSEDLADLILPLVHEYDEAREMVKSTRKRDDEPGPMEMWSSEGMGESLWRLFPAGMLTVAELIGTDRENLVRTLFKVDWVGYGKADEWLTALDLGHRMNELHPVPNPTWSAERWRRWANENRHC